MKFVTKPILHYLPHLRQCKNFVNWLRSDKVTESLKVGTSLETQCSKHNDKLQCSDSVVGCSRERQPACKFCLNNPNLLVFHGHLSITKHNLWQPCSRAISRMPPHSYGSWNHLLDSAMD